jgi:hypothetical protein
MTTPETALYINNVCMIIYTAIIRSSFYEIDCKSNKAVGLLTNKEVLAAIYCNKHQLPENFECIQIEFNQNAPLKHILQETFKLLISFDYGHVE